MLFLIRLDPVLLYDGLFDPFDHRSRLNAITDVVRAAVIAVTVDPPLRCSSGSSITFNVIGVSSWFFPSRLFHHYRSPVTGVASKVEDDMWGRIVSDPAFKIDFSILQI